VKRAALCLLVGASLSAPIAFAETLYVTDHVTVGLHTDVTPGAGVLTTVSTGEKLEVLERSGSFVRVRDSDGIEGWIDATALAAEPPATQRLKTLRAELDRTRAQLANVQGQLEKSRAAPAPDTDKIQAALATTRAQLGKLRLELKSKDEELAAAGTARDTAVKEAATLREAVAREAAARASATQATAVETASPQAPPPLPKSRIPFLWLGLGIAFAMLVLGFVGGVLWVKESIRRRMGGLYLRV
jgi:SH3 domain protein